MARVVAPEVLGRWSAGSGPLYRRLADSIRNAMARGDIPVDSRLPAERALARALNVSRSTVISAYDALYAEGLVVRKKGSGTWVAPRSVAATRRAHLGDVWTPNAALRSIVDTPGSVIPFTASTVDRDPDSLPREAFALAFEEVVGERPYFEIPEGLPELRALIAETYAARGLPTSPDQIVVTAGAQQAISLIAAAHVTSGDLALLESPTFPGAIDALSLIGARLRGISVGPRGADVGSLERSVAQGHVALVYLVPTFHNPTGTLMPASERADLAEIVDRWDVVVIDDESLVDLSFGLEPPPPLAAFAPDARIFSVGSLSKLFWGGLRIGWVRCPREVVGRIARLKSVNDLSCSLVSQAVALKLMDERDSMIDLRRRQLVGKLDLFSSEIARLLPSWTFERPAGGLSLWVDTGADVGVLAQTALREGVAIVTSAETMVEPVSPTHIRLPLLLPDEVVVRGLERLQRAFANLGGEATTVARPFELVV